MKQPWTKAGTEPALWEVLADPIVLSLMKADRVTRTDVLRAGEPAVDRRERTEDPVRMTA